MAIKVKTDGTRYSVALPPKPKLDMEGRQRTDRVTGVGLSVTQLIQLDEDGAEIINCTTPGVPDVGQGAEVIPTNLIAIPWQQGQRSGVAYRADSIEHVPAAGSASAPSSGSSKGSGS
ncbi:hypothetical protein [Actinomycetospora sp. CA-053990]|uniref:hypothetical protein n=1 Tax=Actinomycetospora sp. CA-053990 TaxID=3239891 RepID=UPI003D9343A7